MAGSAVAGQSGLDTGELAAMRRRAILSCAIGNFFELFDFTIYGFFAAQIGRKQIIRMYYIPTTQSNIFIAKIADETITI